MRRPAFAGSGVQKCKEAGEPGETRSRWAGSSPGPRSVSSFTGNLREHTVNSRKEQAAKMKKRRICAAFDGVLAPTFRLLENRRKESRQQNVSGITGAGRKEH